MPDRSEILAGLTNIANSMRGLAVTWHIALAALGLAMFFGLRLSRRALALLLSAPLASVAACAAYFGNPFNALVLGATATLAAVLAYRSGSRAPLSAAGGWPRILGLLLVAFGWLYPHFLEGPSFQYLYAAPLGTIPCPTLSVVIGVALLGGGLVGGAWSLLLATVGSFYAIFGAARLGVTIDWVLLAGALGLYAQTWHTLRGARRLGRA